MLLFAPIYGLMGILYGGYYALWQNELLANGFSVGQLATVIAIQTALSTAVSIPSGMIADRIGHKATALSAFGAYALAFSLPLFIQSRVQFGAAVILVSIADAVLNGALESWAADLQQEREGVIRAQRFAERDQIMRLGMIFGGLAIPFLVGRFSNHRALAWALYLTLAIGAFITAMRTPRAKTRNTGKTPVPRWEVIKLFEGGQRIFLTQFYVGTFLFGVADGVIATCFWPSVRAYGIKNAAAFGLIETSMSLARLSGLQLWKRCRWIDDARLPGWSLLISGALFSGFALSRNLYFAIPFWILRIMALSIHFSTVRAVLVREEGLMDLRATTLAVYGVTVSLGSTLTAATLGWVEIGSGGLVWACSFGAIMTLTSGWVLTFAGKKAKAAVANTSD